MLVTSENYDAALSEIDELFDVKSGTPEFDRLLVVFDAIHEYEEAHYPIQPPSLWYRFLATLRDLCWTVMGAPVRDEDVTL